MMVGMAVMAAIWAVALAASSMVVWLVAIPILLAFAVRSEIERVRRGRPS